jgi:hypothetical protein
MEGMEDNEEHDIVVNEIFLESKKITITTTHMPS